MRNFFLLIPLLVLLFLGALYSRLVSLVDTQLLFDFRQTNISQLDLKNLPQKFEIFRKKLEVFQPTPAIEENLKKMFLSYKENISPGVATESFQLIAKMRESSSFEETLKLCDLIMFDKYSYQFLQAEAVRIVVCRLLEKKAVSKAFAYLKAGFCLAKTPSIVHFGYIYQDLLDATNEILHENLTNSQIEAIVAFLEEGKIVAQYNFTQTTSSYYKLELYYFDFLIYRSYRKLAIEEKSAELEISLIRALEKILRINLVLEIFDSRNSLPTHKVFFIHGMLSYLASSGKGIVPSCPRINRTYIQKLSKSAAFAFFLLGREIYSIYLPMR